MVDESDRTVFQMSPNVKEFKRVTERSFSAETSGRLTRILTLTYRTLKWKLERFIKKCGIDVWSRNQTERFFRWVQMSKNSKRVTERSFRDEWKSDSDVYFDLWNWCVVEESEWFFSEESKCLRIPDESLNDLSGTNLDFLDIWTSQKNLSEEETTL